MTTQSDTTTKRICHECIGDEALVEEVKEKGVLGQCSYCAKSNETLPLREVADRIHQVLGEHFELTPDYPDEAYEHFLASEGKWERRGEPVESVICDIACVNEEIASHVRTLLSDQHSFLAVKDGIEDHYDSWPMYEEREPDDWGFRFTWKAFRREIQSRSRFLNSNAEQALNDIFGDLDTYRTYLGRSVIREIVPGDPDSSVWRARVAQSHDQLQDILKSPTSEIGPPPSKLAKAGRMNAEGISVFYGAMDMETCVSEIRAPVGNRVVVGKFELLRTVQLLDLSAMAEVSVNISYFDSNYAIHKASSCLSQALGE